MVALKEGWIAACPNAPSVLATAIRSSRASRDTAHLYALAFDAADVRDAAVLGAALEVAADASAEEPARAAAMLVLVGQFGLTYKFAQVSGSALLTETLPAQGSCTPWVRSEAAFVSNPLPDDAERRTAVVLDRIAYGTGRPFLRNLARCSRSAVSEDIPPQIDVSRVRVSYVCGNEFRVHNNTPESLVFGYSVDGSEDSGDLNINAHKHRTIEVDGAGTFRLTYDGRVIATAANEGKECR